MPMMTATDREAAVPAAGVAARLPPPRRRRRGLGALVLLALAAWAGACVWQAVVGRRAAQRGVAELRAVQDELSAAQVLRGEGVDELRRAREDFARAADALGHPVLWPARFLPVLGRQVRAVQAMADAAHRVTTVGVDTMEATSERLERRPAAGRERIALLRDLERIAGRAREALAPVSLGPGEALVGPVDRARREVATQVARVRRGVADAEAAAGGLAEMATGPSRYLVLAANNAEMRAGSGMLLSAGVLEVVGGRFRLGPMTTTADLRLPPGRVPLGGDYAARWGWLEPTSEWRYLAMTPRFPATARLAARMWQARTGEPVDGVLAVDPYALRAIIAATGPVEVDGRPITAQNVVRELLLEQYRAVSDDPVPEQELADQLARRERLSRVASAVIARLDAEDWDLARLVDALVPAARGRHILAWSAVPAQGRAWRAAGVDGALRRSSLMVSVLNRSGNKLDQFLSVEAALAARPVRDGVAVRLRLRIRNLAPEGLGWYVLGPYPYSSLREGQYRGIVAVNLPWGAGAATLRGVERVVASGSDGPTRVIAGDIDLDRGETGVVTLRFRVPRGAERVRIEPSARSPETAWRVGGARFADDRAHAVDLGELARAGR